MKTVTTFHLYHHLPDPLPKDQVREDLWLLGNALRYDLVAVINAQDHQEALLAAHQQARGEHVPRPAEVQVGKLFRDTLPGDVLVSSRNAWMVQANGTLHQLSSTRGNPSTWLSQDYTVTSLSWSPDGHLLLAAEKDHRVVIHTLDQEHTYPPRYQRDQYATTCVAWSPHGGRAASGGYHGEVHLWTPTLWRSEGHVGSLVVCCTDEPRSPSFSITCLTWSPDGTLVLAGRDDGQVVQWDARTGNSCTQAQRHTKAVTALVFAPHREHWVLSASSDATIRIWETHHDQEAQRYHHHKGVTAAVWSPDGLLVASCEQDDAAIHLWDPSTGQLLERLPLSVSTTRPPTALSLAWSPDGRWLAAGCDDGTIQTFALASSLQVRSYQAGSEGAGEILALAWSPDGQWLASAGTGLYHYKMHTNVWDMRRDLDPTEAEILTATVPA